MSEKLAEATRRFHDLEVEIGTTASQSQTTIQNQDVEAGAESIEIDSEDAPVLVRKVQARRQHLRGRRKLKELKFSVSEFYLSLILIQNFQVYLLLTMFFINVREMISFGILFQ